MSILSVNVNYVENAIPGDIKREDRSVNLTS